MLNEEETKTAWLESAKRKGARGTRFPVGPSPIPTKMGDNYNLPGAGNASKAPWNGFGMN